MTIGDRLLQHHNHPAKLLLDALATAAAAVLLWQQHLIRGAIVAIGVPAVASAIVFAFADTTKPRSMTAGRLATRVVGALVLWGGAWWTSPWICASGAVLLALSVVDVAPIDTSARRLVTSVADRRGAARGAVERRASIIASAFVALALIDIVVL